jgi:phage terminase large subunit GpA-like protein
MDQHGTFDLTEDVTDDYFAQLVSEAQIRKPSHQASWVQRSRDNPYLECEALAYAAGHLLNVQRIREATESEAKDALPSEQHVQEKPVQTHIATRKFKRPRTVVRSKYLMR